ncbi:hypothetical protein GCM10010446_33160 [Streptomyces enissocaesilis]|uniref:MFS transporter n=1 Tax=Streptomyces enissocaesilis TaxID=332589 RepID=A0ABP6JUU2_9ACTN
MQMLARRHRGAEADRRRHPVDRQVRLLQQVAGAVDALSGEPLERCLPGLLAEAAMVLYGLTAPFAAALMDRFGMRRVAGGVARDVFGSYDPLWLGVGALCGAGAPLALMVVRPRATARGSGPLPRRRGAQATATGIQAKALQSKETDRKGPVRCPAWTGFGAHAPSGKNYGVCGASAASRSRRWPGRSTTARAT